MKEKKFEIIKEGSLDSVSGGGVEWVLINTTSISAIRSYNTVSAIAVNAGIVPGIGGISIAVVGTPATPRGSSTGTLPNACDRVG